MKKGTAAIIGEKEFRGPSCSFFCLYLVFCKRTRAPQSEKSRAPVKGRIMYTMSVQAMPLVVVELNSKKLQHCIS